MIARLSCICLLTLPVYCYQPTGTIRLNVVTTRGGVVSPGRVTVRAADGNVVYSTDLREELTTQPLQFGTYEITFEARGWRTTSRRIFLDRSEVFVTLGTLPDNSIVDDVINPVAVSLRVHSPGSCHMGGSLWARLVGVFSGSIQDAQVSPAGFALFEQVDDGKYALLVIDGEDVRAVQVINTGKPVTVVDVGLSECRGPRN